MTALGATPRSSADAEVGQTGRPSLAHPWLVFAAAGLQLAAGTGLVEGRGWGGPVVLASHAVVAAWLVVNAVANRRWLRRGVVLAAVGWSLNLAVMLPNGGMPVSYDAQRAVGVDPVDVTEGHLSKHVPLTDGTRLAAVADIHVLRPLGMVYSTGDVLLAAGLAVSLAAIASGMRAGAAAAEVDAEIDRSPAVAHP